MGTNLEYPQKLGRFKRGSCIDIYYSEPIANGVFTFTPTETVENGNKIQVTITLVSREGWMAIGGIFSAGVLSGKIVDYDSGTSTAIIEVSKDSWVTILDKDNFFYKKQGIEYRFEVLRHYNNPNASGEIIQNAIKFNVPVLGKQRFNNYGDYSPFGFNYSRDFHYVLTTGSVKFKDLTMLDEFMRATSYVIVSTDESTVNDLSLSNDPDVIGIVNDTAGIITQPYYGGLQDNIYYRASLIDTDMKWENNMYRGKLKFKING